MPMNQEQLEQEYKRIEKLMYEAFYEHPHKMIEFMVALNKLVFDAHRTCIQTEETPSTLPETQTIQKDKT